MAPYIRKISKYSIVSDETYVPAPYTHVYDLCIFPCFMGRTAEDLISNMLNMMSWFWFRFLHCAVYNLAVIFVIRMNNE